jgi:fructokinase
MSTSGQSLALIFGECLVDWIDGLAIPGGAPFNVGRHLAAFGLPVQILTRLGRDAHGQLLLDELHRFGVGTALLQFDEQYPSGQVLVHKNDHGHRFEILANQAYDHIKWDPAAMGQVLHPGVDRPWLVFGTLAQRSETNRQTLQALRQAVPHRAYCDLNWRDGHVAPDLARQVLYQADVLKLSAEELALMLEWCGLDDAHALIPPVFEEPRADVAALLGGTRVSRLVVTYGGDGYAQFDVTGRCQHRGVAMPLASMVDTVGAGDAFSAVTLMGAMLGWPDDVSLARANEFAAAICQVPGAAPQDLTFYTPWKQRWLGTSAHKI